MAEEDSEGDGTTSGDSTDSQEGQADNDDGQKSKTDSPTDPSEPATSPEAEQAAASNSESRPGDRPATQQGAKPLIPLDFNVQKYRKSYVGQLRVQSGLLLGLGTAVFIGNIPATFGLGVLVTASIMDGPFVDGPLGDEGGFVLMALVTSNLSAHVTFAAVSAIVRGVMELRIANQLRQLHSDDSRRRRQLLAGWSFGAPVLPTRGNDLAWAGSR